MFEKLISLNLPPIWWLVTMGHNPKTGLDELEIVQFDSKESAAEAGERWQKNNNDNPRWQVLNTGNIDIRL